MLITGRNAVSEALKSDATAEKLYVQKGENTGVIKNIVSIAREKRIIISFVDKTALDKITQNARHQGVALIQTEYVYSTPEEIVEYANSTGRPPFIVIADEIEDPHNLGGIIRTAECAGVHGIIIGKHRSASVNDTVLRCSAGAASHVRIAKVTNVNDAIKYLKEQNIYVYCADMDGEPMYNANLKGAIALVIGGEGSGVKRLTRELADGVISIPMQGKINSLNASVAAAVVVYEKVRQDLK